MIRSARPRLYDIDQNIRLVIQLKQGRSVNDLQTDLAFSYAIQHAVLIIAEAVRHLPHAMTSRYPDMPWRQIADTGNRLRHEYFRVDPDILWSIVETHLPNLQPVIAQMLQEEGGTGKSAQKENIN